MGGKEKESDDQHQPWEGGDRGSIPQHQPWEGRDRGSIPPGFVFLGIFGAAAATAASGQWRKPVDWFYTQLWRSGYYSRFGSGVPGSGQKERAWAQYRRRVQEMEEDERERVERIRRMQEVFSRERNKHKRSPEQWTEHGTSAGWHQQFQRDDWYYKAQSQNANQGTNYQSASKQNSNHAKSHHYAILGLDR